MLEKWDTPPVDAMVQMKEEMPDIIPVFTICGPTLEKRKKWAHTSGTHVFPDIQVATYFILISALEPLVGATVGGNESISFCFFIQPKCCLWYPLTLQSYSVFHLEDPQPTPILPPYPSLNTLLPTCSFFLSLSRSYKYHCYGPHSTIKKVERGLNAASRIYSETFQESSP